MQSTAFEWLKKMCFFVKKKLAKKKTSPGFFVTPKKCSTKKHPTFGKESQTLKKSKKTKKNSDVSPKNCSWFQPRLLSSFKTSCNLFHSSKLTAWVEKKKRVFATTNSGPQNAVVFFSLKQTSETPTGGKLVKVLSVKMLCHFEFAHLKQWSGWMENCLNLRYIWNWWKVGRFKACFRELFLRKERVDRNSLFQRHVNYHHHDFWLLTIFLPHDHCSSRKS